MGGNSAQHKETSTNHINRTTFLFIAKHTAGCQVLDESRGCLSDSRKPKHGNENEAFIPESGCITTRVSDHRGTEADSTEIKASVTLHVKTEPGLFSVKTVAVSGNETTTAPGLASESAADAGGDALLLFTGLKEGKGRSGIAREGDSLKNESLGVACNLDDRVVARCRHSNVSLKLKDGRSTVVKVLMFTL